MRHGSLFSGIGGFDLAAEWAGWTNVFHCEYNPFGQRVLKHYWPNAISYGDIKQTDFTIHRGEIDVLSGGFPCQPFSAAGKRKGTEDERHLWPEMLRAIREISPRWIVGENVRGFTNWNGGMVFDQVQTDLEAEGYEVLPFLLPACAVNAPHRRDRIWIVAHRTGKGLEGRAKRKEGGVQFAERSKQATENTDQDGRGSVKREEEPKERGFRHVGTGNNERLRADNEDIGTTAHAKDNGDRGELRGLEGENGSERQPEEHRQDNAKSWDNGKERTTPDTDSIESQGGIRKTRSQEAERHPLRGSTPLPGWQDFPTQPPIRTRDDGFSRQLVRFVESEFYGTISENDRIQNLQEVWERVSSEEVWNQVRGLYSLERKDVLFQTMQLYQAGAERQVVLSPFSETFSGPIMQKLRKYGKFASTPQGQELEKQRQKQFGNSLWFLPHEIPLASRAFETQLAKFDAWHRKESIMAYGNAIVPQLAFEIFKVINAMSKNTQ